MKAFIVRSLLVVVSFVLLVALQASGNHHVYAD